jgi:acyl-coenzyme A synthetase/AMP-(fatty) acid ligase
LEVRILHNLSFLHNNDLPALILLGVAAGLRCTLANSAYTSHELAYQYTDSGAKLILTAEEGISTVRAMFAELGLSKDDGDKRTIVLSNDLRWAGGPGVRALPDAAGFLGFGDLLSRGQLVEEEKFEGAAALETAYLCYSSGTTGKPKVSIGNSCIIYTITHRPCTSGCRGDLFSLCLRNSSTDPTIMNRRRTRTW